MRFDICDWGRECVLSRGKIEYGLYKEMSSDSESSDGDARFAPGHQGTNVYVLKLKENKYYVGKTDCVKTRVAQHMKGLGSAWTRKYPPCEMVEVRENVGPFEEDVVTKEYMLKHGIESVRGGSYTQLKLNSDQYCLLQKELRGATDTCFKCGRDSHWASDCYAKTSVDTASQNTKAVPRPKRPPTPKINVCYTCGREGHYSPDCYARTDVNGNRL